ncbi:MAG: ATP-binding cassette domain-containing protein, partial [Oscillospiraceae bacterium]|nr:ATP-binding cassette domain-containing protein [Oscillospiraceae bacterium]
MTTNIEIKNVTKTIHGSTVLDDISLSMKSGVIYGFQGINGSGKTMLMRIVSGLIYPTSGIIMINGKTLGREITFPESIGIFLESPSFLDNYSGLENLKMLASIQNKIDEKTIKNCIKMVGLNPDDKKKYRKYS